MKVYQVVGGWNYEGYSVNDEVKVFSLKEKADEYQKVMQQDVYDFVDVFEFEVQ